MIYELSRKIRSDKIQRVLPFAVISAIGILGLLISFIIINSDFNSSYFRAYAAIVQNLPDSYNQDKQNGANVDDNQPILVGRYWTKSFIWATQYAFDKRYNFVRDDLKCCSDPSERRLEEIIIDARNNNVNNNSSTSPIPKIILVADSKMKRDIQDNTSEEKYEKIKTLYDLTHTLKIIDEKRFPHNREIYPYSALYDNRGVGKIEIRSN
jgi:hypothetical protein